jgi:hypothetical protein
VGYLALSWLASSQSYITTDVQSASLSWCQAPIWGRWEHFDTVRQLWFCWCGAPSSTRGRVCSLQLLLCLANAVILEFDSRRTHDHILLPQIWDSPKRHVPVIISFQSRVSQLYSKTLGSLFVAPYDSQGYGGGVRTASTWDIPLVLGTDPTENTLSCSCCVAVWRDNFDGRTENTASRSCFIFVWRHYSHRDAFIALLPS